MAFPTDFPGDIGDEKPSLEAELERTRAQLKIAVEAMQHVTERGHVHWGYLGRLKKALQKIEQLGPVPL